MASLLKSFLIVIVPFVTVYSVLLFTLTLPPISDYEQDPITSLEKDVTAIIKVHKRADIAVRAAFSIYALYPSLAIVMVDDSPAPIDIQLPPNTQYFRIPENTGISYGRNFAVKKVETKYTLLMDDDWLLTNRTYLVNAYEVLEANHSIGIVAGLLCLKEPMDSCYGYHGSLEIVEKKLTYKDNVIREDMGNGCQLVDLGENAMLARTEILRQYPWDERLKNAEHEDFYLSLKGHVNVASCPFFKILHKRPSLDAYAGYQYDRDLWGHQNILCKKWDLVGFNMMYTEWQRDCPEN